MNRGQLRARLRSAYLDDQAEPYLWSDDLLDALIEEAQQEAAIRSRLLSETIQLPLVAGQGSYSLPASALDVVRVRTPGLTLARTSQAELDEQGAWEQRSGQPRSYAFTAAHFGGDGELIVYPAPASAYAAAVTLQRLPAALSDDASQPELPIHLHLFLLDWAAFRAFSLRDSDAEDSARAAKHEAAFEAVFGERLDADTLRQRAERRPHRIKTNSDWR
ncbi:hypothetical protein E5198_00890 [Pseudomonas sp. A-1]|uniref:phage adaptor protein n=1 Tax=Pseudomonas sp. A-1 TaxID=1821274 RepID=UPI0010A69AA6|nr:DUF6682 family protein [Pseudomonas sp. A-1]THG87102.1 hypothetical protein E5198_00890 [Pseudomonas sp. A-1]